MRILSTMMVSGALAMVLAAGCQKKDETPAAINPTNPMASAYPGAYPQQGVPQQGYPQQGMPQQGYQQGYPQQGMPQQGMPMQPGMAPMGAPPGPAMAVPGPAALPCQNDSACVTARCNVQYGKCAFPCQNAEVDCVQGNACMAGFCVPKLPGQ